jgi:hypothetical protein
MPAGSLCEIQDTVVVNRGIVVGQGSGLGAGGSLTVDGPLSVGDNGAVIIGFENPYAPLVSSVAGPLRADEPSMVQVHNTHIYGPVEIAGGVATILRRTRSA